MDKPIGIPINDTVEENAKGSHSYESVIPVIIDNMPNVSNLFLYSKAFQIFFAVLVELQ